MKWRSVSMREALLWARTREIASEEENPADRVVQFTDGSAVIAISQGSYDPPEFEIGEP